MRNRIAIKSTPYPAPIKLKAIGDSNTYGYAASPIATARWTYLTAQALGVGEENYGESGWLLQRTFPVSYDSGIETYIPDLCQGSKYDYVVCAYGLNDVRYDPSSISVQGFKKTYIEMMTGIMCHGYLPSRVLLLSPNYMDPTKYAVGDYNDGTVEKHEAHRDAVYQVSQMFGVKYLDMYQLMKDYPTPLSLLAADGVHLNNAGNIFYKDNILTILP